MLAVRRLKGGVATDVDELEGERTRGTRLADDLERSLAEVTARRVKDRNGS